MSNIIDKIQLSGITYDIGGQGGSGVSVLEVTQAEYDELPSSAKTDTSKMYVITDAQAGDLTNYYTKTETNTLLGGKADTATTYTKTEVGTLLGGKADTATTYTKTEVDNAITAATSTKQDTLVSSENIKTINNISILGSGNIDIQGGGGGKAVAAGTNISITTGETADTINCTLPISAGTGANSVMFGQPSSTSDASGSKTITGGQWSKAYSEGAVSIGQMNEARGQWAWAIGNGTRTNGKASFACGDLTSAFSNFSFSEGTYTTANTEASHAAGSYTSTKNRSEFSIGEYNNSVSASTTFGDSGNTLFSVGNGTANNARHNAFEIRQNGDIYLTKDGQDVKLQDQLGGGGGGISSAECQTMIDQSISGKADSDDVYTTGQTSGATELATAFAATQPKLSAGTGISIDANNVISATGGGGGLTEDDELLLSTALTDLNDRKIDASEVKSQLENYQRKGDYVTTNTLNTRLAEYETALDEQNVEEVTAYALNDLNNRFGGLKIVKITESEYTALTTKDENTLYIVVADPS